MFLPVPDPNVSNSFSRSDILVNGEFDMISFKFWVNSDSSKGNVTGNPVAVAQNAMGQEKLELGKLACSAGENNPTPNAQAVRVKTRQWPPKWAAVNLNPRPNLVASEQEK